MTTLTRGRRDYTDHRDGLLDVIIDSHVEAPHFQHMDNLNIGWT